MEKTSGFEQALSPSSNAQGMSGVLALNERLTVVEC